MITIENHDGKLYADITPIDLGLPARTTMCNIPIPYATQWKEIGEAFKERAQATCPVDTGYLRAHIDFQADGGGLEVWSDAPYSAYQEYGTSKMRAQPYFEASINEACNAMEGAMHNLAAEFNDMDSDFWFLCFRGGREGTIAECYEDLARLDRLIAFMQNANATSAAEAGWYYDLAPLYDARDEIYARIEELRELEAQAQADKTGLLAMMLMAIIEALLMAPFVFIETLLQDVTGGIDDGHYPQH